MNHTTPQTGATQGETTSGERAPVEAWVTIAATSSFTLRRVSPDAGRAVPVVPESAVVVPQMWQASREVRAQLARVVVLLLEVLDGRRPVAGVAVLVAPSVARYLRATRRVRPGAASRVVSVHVFTPRPGAAEVAAVCRISGKARAVALRFELDTQPDDGPGWRVTALRVL